MLLSNNTLFIFIAAVQKQKLKMHHIHDIGNGIRCLERHNIPIQNIVILTDVNEKVSIDSILKEYTEQEYILESQLKLEETVNCSSHENLVVFVTGDGNVNGLDGITTHYFLNSLWGNKNIKNIVVYLCQCYAGTFKYLDIKHKNTVLIGSTNLYPSISNSIDETQVKINIFMYYIFKGIKDSVDTDGDNYLTVMDTYKYASAMTNSECLKQKSTYIKDSLEYLRIVDKYENKQLNINEQMVFENAKDALFKRSITQYNSQEQWISNPELALKLKFK